MGRNKDTDTDVSYDDAALWDYVTKDVMPMHPTTPATPKKAVSPIPRPAPRTVIVTPKPVAPVATAAQGHDIDRRTRQRLERGQMAIEAVLDLHGYSQADAHSALANFITRSLGANLRCVLVITGKGKQGQGILKARFRDWLADPSLAPHILEITPAQPNHGGGGAFYVFLRRKRG